jgi:hypothetical protein
MVSINQNPQKSSPICSKHFFSNPNRVNPDESSKKVSQGTGARDTEKSDTSKNKLHAGTGGGNMVSCLSGMVNKRGISIPDSHPHQHGGLQGINLSSQVAKLASICSSPAHADHDHKPHQEDCHPNQNARADASDYNPLVNMKDYISSRPNMFNTSIQYMIDHKATSYIKNITDVDHDLSQIARQQISVGEIPLAMAMPDKHPDAYDTFTSDSPRKMISDASQK